MRVSSRSWSGATTSLIEPCQAAHPRAATSRNSPLVAEGTQSFLEDGIDGIRVDLLAADVPNAQVGLPLRQLGLSAERSGRQVGPARDVVARAYLRFAAG